MSRLRPSSLTAPLALALAFAGLSLVVPTAAASEHPQPGITTVLEGLAGPIDIEVAPDGSIWWNEYYTGNVNRYDPTDDSREVLFHAEPIPDGVERGMLGLALDPDVVENGVFYVFYTVADPHDPAGGTNRLSRIEAGEETVLLTTTASEMHNGGRIEFARDGSMFVSTGDNQRHRMAQEPASLLGKVLHLWPDGTPADDNIEGYVHTMGHRNVYGLAYDHDRDRLFATENSNAERDEINLIEPGNNYGWPHCEGTVRFDPEQYRATEAACDDQRFTPPLGEFTETGTVAPTGAAVVDGRLYWAAWNQGAIHRMVEHPDTGAWYDQVVHEPGGRINDLEADPVAPGLYYSTWGSILRIDLPLAPMPEPADFPDPQPTGGAAKSAAAVSPALVSVAVVAAATWLALGRRRPARW